VRGCCLCPSERALHTTLARLAQRAKRRESSVAGAETIESPSVRGARGSVTGCGVRLNWWVKGTIVISRGVEEGEMGHNSYAGREVSEQEL
jgi:hypothetical protein